MYDRVKFRFDAWGIDRVFYFFFFCFKFRARQPERRHVDTALATLLPRE